MLKKLKPKSEFSRNVLTLMTGTTIAQAIPIAISPILTRIYIPEDFGIFALYMSIASIISVVATGRYELAIMLPKKDDDAINIVVLSILISFVVSFLSLIIVLVFNNQITNLLGNSEIANWLYFIPITVFLTGIYQSFNYWTNRKKHYNRLSTSRVVQSSTTATANLSMGLSSFGGSGLILGGIVGQSISTFMIGKMIWNDDRNKFDRIKKLKILAMAKKYIKFPKFDIPSAIINSLNTHGLIIVFGNIFGVVSLGFYSFSQRLLFLPVSFLSSSVADVTYQKLSSYYNQKEYKNIEILINKLVKRIFFTTTIPFVAIIFSSKYYIVFIFGVNWLNLYKYFYILSISAYALILIIPISNLLKIYSLQNISLRQHISLISAKVLGLFLSLVLEYSFLDTLFLITLLHTITLYINIIEVSKNTKIDFLPTYHKIFIFIFIYLGVIYYAY